MSPFATGITRKSADVANEEEEEIDTAPKKLEWIMTAELKMAVVSG